MAGVRLQLRPVVGVPRSELADVRTPSAGGALRGAAEGSPPSDPSHHGLPQRQHDGGEAALCPEQPGRTLQTLGGPAALLRPVHSRHETDDRPLHSYC